MLEYILHLYAKAFARPSFYRVNKFLLHLSLRGLGVLNSSSVRISGEQNMLRAVMKTLPNNPIVFDVGANVGDYSALVFELRRDARIFAFEPHPITYERLSTRRDIVCDSYAVAVGAQMGRRELYDYADNNGSTHASLHKAVIEEIHKRVSVAHAVNVLTLDSFADENGIDRIHFLKIDAEGNELAVLDGACRLLRESRIDIVHFEFNEMNVISRTFIRDFRKVLDQFTMFRLLPTGALRLKDGGLEELFAYQNILAIRRDYSERNPRLMKALNCT